MLSLHFPKYKNFISEMSVYRDEKNGKGRDYCVSEPYAGVYPVAFYGTSGIGPDGGSKTVPYDGRQFSHGLCYEPV